ncbi:MAG: sugar ABC transporter permease [Deltaproteobacteria bacterium]|uniref:Maltose/maltodextrin transport system permease protein n=1 Tax=Candidatus Zymogenus saltonus TaxID=2844893 RepID=A0A9D8KD75_9DELT|nr:sugar ABC transporter permease [Candidatus Zymogenus saltonus]
MKSGRKTEGLFIFSTLAPIAFFLLVLSVSPILYNVYISTTNMSLYHYDSYDFVGLFNYITIFTSPVSDFFRVGLWNVVYSVVSIAVPFIIGVLAASALTRTPRFISATALPLMILPWVVPAFITILIWKGLFNYNFGAINLILERLGLSKTPWLMDPNLARLSVIAVSVWLGIPFMTTMATGIIRTIPNGVMEAARIDGAGPIAIFTSFTFPLVTRRMIPVLVMGFSASFNNFTAIYLLTAGGPTSPGSIGGAGSTDIIISYIFKLTLQSRRYGLAAAYAVIVFVAIGIITLYNLGWIRRGREEVF